MGVQQPFVRCFAGAVPHLLTDPWDGDNVACVDHAAEATNALPEERALHGALKGWGRHDVPSAFS